MMWFDPSDQRGLFGDQRRETITVIDRTHRADGTRVLSIHPDCLLDFRALPFADHSFPLVVFDPPHLVRAGKDSWLAAKYGKLSKDWRSDLRAGFAECFRVLRQEGVLVFKWSEVAGGNARCAGADAVQAAVRTPERQARRYALDDLH
ncbi:SAM-dependent methyltransferase [Xanthomonas oryzae]|uniref:SAM-dependent methyltransferase n=1 Tax=Xanthomonas oryzae TaxID=347 RepID=UPI001F0E78C9|nr:SAM-dependent methyltransferase [Xanthomonas oryzae]